MPAGHRLPFVCNERDEVARRLLQRQKQQVESYLPTMVGYPLNYISPIIDEVAALAKLPLNNIGDPFVSSRFRINSHPFEVGVIQWFAQLYDLAVEDAWGYVTSGGTEGNIQCLHVARECLPQGILYTSAESHYSIMKAAKMLRVESETIPILPNGEIDYGELKMALEKNKGTPAIINANIGSVFFGAIDNIDKIIQILSECGYAEDEFYIHCDAAFGGLMVPFMQEAAENKLLSFNKSIDSISVSGHKSLGLTIPCGVVIMRKKTSSGYGVDVADLLKSKDTTLLGSRSGHAAIFFWYALSTKTPTRLKQECERCVKNAAMLKAMLDSAGSPAVLNPRSVTVVFQRPIESIVSKWQLACRGQLAHVVVLQHCTPTLMRSFMADFRCAMGSKSRHASDFKRVIAEIS